LGLTSSVLLTLVSPAVWEVTLGNPKGSTVPLCVAGSVLDDDRIRRHLAVLDPRQEPARRKGPRRLPGAAGPLRDWHRRVGSVRALSLNSPDDKGSTKDPLCAPGELSRPLDSLSHSS